ncbi:MAG: DUF4434 domain-containing protein [bacterium]
MYRYYCCHEKQKTSQSKKSFLASATIILIFFTILLIATAFAVRGLDGAFFQIDKNNANWSLIRWGQDLAAMRAVNMNTVICAYAVFDSSAFYPGCSLSGVTVLGQPLDKILTIADTTGMTVHLGLVYEAAWWNNEANTTYLDTITEKNKTVINELYALYNSHSSWQGWYIPTETDNWTTRLESSRQNLVNHYLRPVSDYCHAKDSTKIVSLAPYFNYQLAMDPTSWKGWWMSTLSEATSLDLIMLQDGVGAQAKNYTSSSSYFIQVTAYFSAVKQATDSTHRILWSDLEIFSDTSTWQSASIDRITTQIDLENPYVANFTCWEFPYYMSPNKGVTQSLLYSNYSAYINGIDIPAKTNLALHKTYTVTPSPSPTYPDSGGELTDGLIPDNNWSSELGWFNPGAYPIITLDLGSVYTDITDVWGYCLRDTTAAIYEPQYMMVSTSTNGTSYTFVGNAPKPGAIYDRGTNIYKWNGDGFSGRYIRCVLVPPGNLWTMINELEVYQTSLPIPLELFDFFSE